MSVLEEAREIGGRLDHCPIFSFF